MKLSDSRKGDYQEHLLCILLMKRGYEVFRNISCVGPVDIVAIDKTDMKTIFIDSKSPIVANDGTLKGKQQYITQEQHDSGIVAMTAWDDKIFYWSRASRIAKEF